MKKIILFLLGFILLAIILRIYNLSPFTVYPDSYQNLMVAQNLKTYGSVTGFLGKQGMFYPDFFMWTRPLYPLLINTVSFFSLAPLIAARSIVFVLGILAIPLTYFLAKTVFKNIWAGLIAAFLLTLSYNHTIWSGLPMTESIGVFFMLLFLWQFFAAVAKKAGLFNLQNIFTGVLFALAVLSRYEYLIIAVPVLFYSLKKSSRPLMYLGTVFGSFVITITVFGFLFYPVQTVLPVILVQMSGLLGKILLVSGILILCYLGFRFLPKHYKKKLLIILSNGISIFLGFLFLLSAVLLAFNNTRIARLDVSLFINFFRHDFLLSLFAFIGLLKLLEDKKGQMLAYFVLLSVVLLGFIYYQINPAMERYMTHLIPFLLIPAVYGIQIFFKTAFINQTKNMKKMLVGIFLLFIIAQFGVTLYGLRNLNDPSWYRSSYEQNAAVLVSQKIIGKPILIVSSPEPYFYFTGLSTQSVADTPPYLYLPKLSDKQKLVIVEDMGMHAYFPQFAKVLDTKLSKYKSQQFYVFEVYHISDEAVTEKYPVILYTISYSELKKLVH